MTIIYIFVGILLGWGLKLATEKLQTYTAEEKRFKEKMKLDIAEIDRKWQEIINEKNA